MKYVVAFARFWWNFIVGDDWLVAFGVALALAATALLVDDDWNVWWLLPIAVIFVLAASLRRATQGSRRA
jgi:hypothetical protein